MRYLLAILATLAWAGSAQAQVSGMQVGTLLVCETEQQMEQFVELGATTAALIAVNQRSPMQDVCGPMRLAFVTVGKAVDVMKDGHHFSIVQLMVISSEDPRGQLQLLWHPLTWYALTVPGNPA